MNGDAIDPSLQTGLAMKILHPPKHLQEDFLGGIGGIGWVGENPVHNAVDGLVEFSNQPGIGVFGSRLELGNDDRLFRTYADCARKIAHVGCSRHDAHGVTSDYRSIATAGSLVS